MTLRALTKKEIQNLSTRRGVEQKKAETFLSQVGEMSLEGAYQRLRHERNSQKWILQTTSAVSDGLVLATTGCKDERKSAVR